MNNIVLVNLESTYASAYGIWQWDYGQILRIQSKKKLPKAVEVHFSEQEKGGSSITRIGTTADNVTDVPIPDSLLEKREIFMHLCTSKMVKAETQSTKSKCR